MQIGMQVKIHNPAFKDPRTGVSIADPNFEDIDFDHLDSDQQAL